MVAYGYQYNKNGNITSVTDLQTDKTLNSYQYDSLNRLTEDTQSFIYKR